jgi:hypothetical protein
MPFSIQLRLASLIAFMFAGFATSAQASVIVNAVETGGDVVISGGGTLNLAEWVININAQMSGGRVDAGADPSGGRVILGLGSPQVFTDEYSNASPVIGPLVIGTSNIAFFADAGSGDIFGIDFGIPRSLNVPIGYVSGAPLSGSSTYTSKTFASLGIDVGSYVWSWGSGGTRDSFTLNFVPEPSTAVLMSLGLVGLASRRRRP